jgi:hypothetical protein
VVGRVDFSPADPLDAQLVAGFNDHMRTVGAHGRRPLGPSAADAAAEAFRRHGATVLVRETPWRLGPERADLTAEWLRGWVPASVAQRPALAAHSDAYLARRIDELAAGTLRVTLEHIDLLALPAGSSASCGGAA